MAGSHEVSMRHRHGRQQRNGLRTDVRLSFLTTQPSDFYLHTPVSSTKVSDCTLQLSKHLVRYILVVHPRTTFPSAMFFARSSAFLASIVSKVTAVLGHERSTVILETSAYSATTVDASVKKASLQRRSALRRTPVTASSTIPITYRIATPSISYMVREGRPRASLDTLNSAYSSDSAASAVSTTGDTCPTLSPSTSVSTLASTVCVDVSQVKRTTVSLTCV